MIFGLMLYTPEKNFFGEDVHFGRLPCIQGSFRDISTLHVGGKIAYLVAIRTQQEAEEALRWAVANTVSWLPVGKGSNLLPSDAPFEGAVFLNKIDFIHIDGTNVSVGGGVSLPQLSRMTTGCGLAGLEFAIGIPGSLGGAIYMNAGAEGQDMAMIVREVTYLQENGSLSFWQRHDIEFGYRSSSFQRVKGMIIQATLELTYDPLATERRQSFLAKRQRTQPLKAWSAGCIFRNPSREMSAGYLIDLCGLKGFAIGDAEVSKLHANFLINRGQAKAADIGALIAQIQEEVHQKTGVWLETEVCRFDR
jgi:UDP-N-acetylmuramate dehydrogenase